MSERVWNVIFGCTGTPARSIIAESLMNHLGKSRSRAWPAGSFPPGEIKPNTLRALSDMRPPVDGPRSTSSDEFTGPDARELDLVFTVCDRGAGEVCPIWPGQPMTAHWGMPDSAEATRTPEHAERQFKDTVVTLKRRIELLLAQPVSALDRLILGCELDRIGRG